MKLNFEYNPEATEEEGFAPFPKDYYLCQITDAVFDATKRNDGHYIKFEMVVIQSGPFKGRKVWDIFMVDSHKRDGNGDLIDPTDMLKRAGDRLSLAHKALDIQPIKDSAELHRFLNKVVEVKVETVKDKDDKSNTRVYGYRKPASITQSANQGRTLRNQTVPSTHLTEDDIPF